MKHLKKYNESVSNEFTFFDIIDIIQDIIDDGYDIWIFSATGHSYRPEDTDRADIFKFHRYQNDIQKSFKIQISFQMSLEYSALADFLTEMKLPIARFDDAGFRLSQMDPEVNVDSDLYRCYGVQYSFESHN